MTKPKIPPTRKGNDGTEQGDRKWNRAGIVIQFFGLLGLIYYAWQAQLQAGAAIDAAKAAKIAADAAAASSAAWLAVGQITVVRDGDEMYAIAHVFNGGPTPAMAAANTWEAQFVPGLDESYRPKFGGCPTSNASFPGLMIPGNGTRLHMRKALDDKQWEMVVAGTARVHFHFCTAYKDAFGRDGRFTEYAFGYPMYGRTLGDTEHAIIYEYARMQ